MQPQLGFNHNIPCLDETGIQLDLEMPQECRVFFRLFHKYKTLHEWWAFFCPSLKSSSIFKFFRLTSITLEYIYCSLGTSMLFFTADNCVKDTGADPQIFNRKQSEWIQKMNLIFLASPLSAHTHFVSLLIVLWLPVLSYMIGNLVPGGTP